MASWILGMAATRASHSSSGWLEPGPAHPEMPSTGDCPERDGGSHLLYPLPSQPVTVLLD